MSDRWKKASVIIQALGLCALIFAAYSVSVASHALDQQRIAVEQQSIAIKQQRDAVFEQHEWNRRHFTVMLVREFYEDVGPFLDSLRESFPGLYHSGEKAHMSRDQADTLYDAKPGDPKYQLRHNVVGYLNYIEFLCSAYEAHVVNHDVFKDSFEAIVVRAYEQFEEFIEVAQDEQGAAALGPIIRVAKQWTASPPSKKNLDPPGELKTRP